MAPASKPARPSVAKSSIGKSNTVAKSAPAVVPNETNRENYSSAPTKVQCNTRHNNFPQK